MELNDLIAAEAALEGGEVAGSGGHFGPWKILAPSLFIICRVHPL